MPRMRGMLSTAPRWGIPHVGIIRRARSDLTRIIAYQGHRHNISPFSLSPNHNVRALSTRTFLSSYMGLSEE